MPSPILTSPKFLPPKRWVLGPKPSFGQAAKGWAGKQQGSAGKSAWQVPTWPVAVGRFTGVYVFSQNT